MGAPAYDCFTPFAKLVREFIGPIGQRQDKGGCDQIDILIKINGFKGLINDSTSAGV
jgi:hypothetical protein